MVREIQRSTDRLSVVDWESHITADLRKKCKLPWHWCRLNAADLDILGDLSPAEYGAYCRLLTLATTNDNRTPYKLGFLKRRAGLTTRHINVLIDRGLAEVVPDLNESVHDVTESASNPIQICTKCGLKNESCGCKKNQQNQGIDTLSSGDDPDAIQKKGALQGRDRDKEITLQGKGQLHDAVDNADLLDANANDTGSTPVPHVEKDSTPATACRPSISAFVRQASESVRAPGVRAYRNNGGRQRGHDRRPFPEIVELTRELIQMLRTSDPATLHKLGGRSRGLSAEQIKVAVQQLHEDGEL